MKIITITTKHHVYAKWLKSELYRVRESLTPTEIALIETPDLQNENDNTQREDLLLNKYGRSAILQQIPGNTTWHEVEIENADTGQIYVCPVFDWFLDTGRTFRLSHTTDHLAPNRGWNFSSTNKGDIAHHQKITEMTASPQSYEDIVMISTATSDKPFTIIDGTHRATFLHRNNNLSGTKGFLGIADDLSQCMWSIERATFQSDIRELNQLAAVGMLW